MSAAWERQADESAPAFQAFARYRDLGEDRSIREVAKQVDKSETLIGRWSSRWGWVERAAAWDNHQDEINRKARQKAIREMQDRHAKEATALQGKALERLRIMQPAELTPGDVLRFFVEAAKLERVSRGEPETIETHDIHGEVVLKQKADLTRLSDEELITLEQLVHKSTQPERDTG